MDIGNSIHDLSKHLYYSADNEVWVLMGSGHDVNDTAKNMPIKTEKFVTLTISIVRGIDGKIK